MRQNKLVEYVTAETIGPLSDRAIAAAVVHNLTSSPSHEGILTTIAVMPAEFATPHWCFGMSHLAFTTPLRLHCSHQQGGFSHFALIDVAARQVTHVFQVVTIASALQANGLPHRLVVLAMASTMHATSRRLWWTSTTRVL